MEWIRWRMYIFSPSRFTIRVVVINERMHIFLCCWYFEVPVINHHSVCDFEGFVWCIVLNSDARKIGASCKNHCRSWKYEENVYIDPISSLHCVKCELYVPHKSTSRNSICSLPLILFLFGYMYILYFFFSLIGP